MKKTLCAALSLSLLLCACSTSSTTKVTTYDAEGNTVSTSTTTSTSNQAVDAVVKAGTAVKDGVTTGYEWVKENAKRVDEEQPAAQ